MFLREKSFYRKKSNKFVYYLFWQQNHYRRDRRKRLTFKRRGIFCRVEWQKCLGKIIIPDIIEVSFEEEHTEEEITELLQKDFMGSG